LGSLQYHMRTQH